MPRDAQPAELVRHWTLYHSMPNALQDACRTQEAEGFRLDRIIPYTDQQSIAVFVRVEERTDAV